MQARLTSTRIKSRTNNKNEQLLRRSQTIREHNTRITILMLMDITLMLQVVGDQVEGVTEAHTLLEDIEVVDNRALSDIVLLY
jgi:hypothetical protein